MLHLRKYLAWLLIGAALAAGCSPKAPPKPIQPAGQATPKPPQRPDLVQPIENGLLALRAMNDAGKNKDIPGAAKAFQQFRTDWAAVRPDLDKADPKLAKHIEDGAVELDVEFAKAADQFRFYEIDEETVKIGRLLSQAAALLGAPIRADLVQTDPTADIPFNQEQRIAVTLTEHKIEPNVITIPQHTKVTFVVTNKGKELHQFVLGHYAVEVEELKPGQTRELTLVMLDAGEFETACYEPGHYEVGQHGLLKVTPAELKQK